MSGARPPDADADHFRRVRFPSERKLVLDALRLGHSKPMMHALLELDVTRARELLRQHHERTGRRTSFTAFIAACVGRAVAAHPAVHAVRDIFGRLVMFTDFDVSTLVEVTVDDRKFGMAHVLRAANRRGADELGDELHAVKHAGFGSLRPGLRRGFKAFLFLPGFLRRWVFRASLRSPRFMKRNTGTVTLTAVGMFGRGVGWGVSAPTIHSLAVLVGGISPRAASDGSSGPREILCLTVSADHDIVDGAPLARFVTTLRDHIESALGLSEAGPDPTP